MIMILILVTPALLRIIVAAALLAAVGGISACGGSGSDGRQTIAATTGITADLAERVAGRTPTSSRSSRTVPARTTTS